MYKRMHAIVAPLQAVVQVLHAAHLSHTTHSPHTTVLPWRLGRVQLWPGKERHLFDDCSLVRERSTLCALSQVFMHARSTADAAVSIHALAHMTRIRLNTF